MTRATGVVAPNPTPTEHLSLQQDRDSHRPGWSREDVKFLSHISSGLFS
jgi:hypothetical protein